MFCPSLAHFAPSSVRPTPAWSQDVPGGKDSKPPSLFALFGSRWFTAMVGVLVRDAPAHEAGSLHPLLRSCVLVFLDWHQGGTLLGPGGCDEAMRGSFTLLARRLVSTAYSPKVWIPQSLRSFSPRHCSFPIP